jgi:CheY-like chemotaxis protein
MGLAMAQGIVRRHEGAIAVDSAPGKGTEFRIWLPRLALDDEAISLPPRNPASTPQQRSLLLLVDDEPDIRVMARRMLRKTRFDLMEAGDGVEALEVYRQHGHRVALVVLDLLMPRLGGAETFRALRSINPEVRIVVTSGYDDGHVRSLLAEGADRFLPKPYTRSQLLCALDQALG